MQWTWIIGAIVAIVLGMTLKRGSTNATPHRIDWIISGVIGISFAGIATLWLSQFHTLHPVLESDFFEYCTGVSAIDLDSPGVSPKRSTLPMILPRFFYSQLGLFDALAMGGIVSAGLLGGTLYLWGRIIAGPIAGMAAGLLGMALGPLTLYTRTLTSYPEMSICFVIAAAATAYGVCSRRYSAAIWAGGGIGLALLADVRGLFWAAPLSATVMIALLLRCHTRKKFIRLALFVGMLVFSFFLGGVFYVPDSIGFQEQVDIRPMFYRFLGPESGFEPAYRYTNPWVWGRHSPLNIIDTTRFLLEQSTIEPPTVLLDRPEVAVGRALARNYLWLCGLAGLSAIWVCRKRLWKLLALLGTTCPFLVALYGNTTLLENHSRFYLQTLPGLALLLGVGFVAIVPGGKCRGKHIVTATALFFAIVLGVLPSPLSPNAGWQIRWQESPDHLLSTIEEYKSGVRDRDPNFRHCRRALHRLELENKPLNVSFYPELRPINPAR